MHIPRSGRRMNKTAIAFGTFDGVHRGHQEIINAMLTAAEGRGLDPLFQPSGGAFRQVLFHDNDGRGAAGRP